MNVIILPGLDGTGKMVAEFAAQLRAGHEVHVISYPTDRALSYTELARFVVSQLPETGAYCILAESFSGPIATRLASDKPNGLRAIVFAASFVKQPTYLPRAVAILANIIPLNSSILLSLAKPFTFGRWHTKQLYELLAKSVSTISSKIIAYRIGEVMRADELGNFADIDLPMLYLRPSQDRLVSKATAEEMSQFNTALNVVDIEGPHFILQAQPEKCSSIISEFLASV